MSSSRVQRTRGRGTAKFRGQIRGHAAVPRATAGGAAGLRLGAPLCPGAWSAMWGQVGTAGDLQLLLRQVGEGLAPWAPALPFLGAIKGTKASSPRCQPPPRLRRASGKVCAPSFWPPEAEGASLWASPSQLLSRFGRARKASVARTAPPPRRVSWAPPRGRLDFRLPPAPAFLPPALPVEAWTRAESDRQFRINSRTL